MFSLTVTINLVKVEQSDISVKSNSKNMRIYWAFNRSRKCSNNYYHLVFRIYRINCTELPKYNSVLFLPDLLLRLLNESSPWQCQKKTVFMNISILLFVWRRDNFRKHFLIRISFGILFYDPNICFAICTEILVRVNRAFF